MLWFAQISRTARCLTLVLSMGLALVFWPGESQAAVTCAYSNGHLQVDLTADNDVATVTRSGPAIRVADAFVGGGQAVTCAGGTATVTDTDSVAIAQNPDTEDQKLNIDLKNGAFGPGATPEADGTSEIEFQLKMNSDADLALIGTDAPDTFLIGLIAPAVVGINTNGAEAVPDFDIQVTGTKDIAILGQGGADLIDGRGIPTTFGSRTFLPLESLSGGEGDDRLLTGGIQSQISGGDGRDSLSGSQGPDVLTGGRGRDTIFSGKGKDSVFAVDHKRDRIQCGGGRDHTVADPRDKLKRCETVTRTGHRFSDPVVIEPFQ